MLTAIIVIVGIIIIFGLILQIVNPETTMSFDKFGNKISEESSVFSGCMGLIVIGVIIFLYFKCCS